MTSARKVEKLLYSVPELIGKSIVRKVRDLHADLAVDVSDALMESIVVDMDYLGGEMSYQEALLTLEICRDVPLSLQRLGLHSDATRFQAILDDLANRPSGEKTVEVTIGHLDKGEEFLDKKGVRHRVIRLPVGALGVMPVEGELAWTTLPREYGEVVRQVIRRS